MKNIFFMAVLCLGISMPTAAQSDFQWTFNNDGTADYTLTAVSSSQVFDGTLPAADPTIALIVGKRYEVTAVNSAVRPFEVLAKGSDSSSDVVLLSQKGSLEPSF